MRLVCTVAIANRLHANLSQKKHVKSTLALCRHPNTENEFMIIHFTAQNKTGTKYKLNDNITGVSSRFVNEGKATIQFTNPPHNLLINAEQIQLKGFLHLMRRGLEKKISGKELTVSSMSVCAVSQKSLPVKRLVIRNRSELPMKGFPRTLESLYINEIQLCKLCIGVLQLQKLKVLDISNNCIETLPFELSKLPLADLNVSYNNLKSTQWDWIGGVLIKSLRNINLSSNNLHFIPENFVKFHSLTSINLNNNHLSYLPSGFGNFRHLRALSVANNALTLVPGSMQRLHLEILDLSKNNFEIEKAVAVYPKTIEISSLKELAARKILRDRSPYDSQMIPYTLVDYLDHAHYCVCGKPCFEAHIQHVNVLMLKLITQTYVNMMGAHAFVPMSCYYCSVRCFKQMM